MSSVFLVDSHVDAAVGELVSSQGLGQDVSDHRVSGCVVEMLSYDCFYQPTIALVMTLA